RFGILGDGNINLVAPQSAASITIDPFASPHFLAGNALSLLFGGAVPPRIDVGENVRQTYGTIFQAGGAPAFQNGLSLTGPSSQVVYNAATFGRDAAVTLSTISAPAGHALLLTNGAGGTTGNATWFTASNGGLTAEAFVNPGGDNLNSMILT